MINLKPKRNMANQTTDRFKEVIKAYLDKRAAEDELFAKSYAKEGKTLDQCIDYILQTVKNSGQCGYADDEIYSMAVHYYDEDNLGDIKHIDSGKVVVNHHVDLTETEKEAAHARAIAKYEAECLAAEKKKAEEAERKRQEAEKRKAEKEAEKRAAMQSTSSRSLFDDFV
jgi:hypothetical protein